MLAHRKWGLPPILSQPVRVQHDHVGESHDSVSPFDDAEPPLQPTSVAFVGASGLRVAQLQRERPRKEFDSWLSARNGTRRGRARDTLLPERCASIEPESALAQNR